jgi:hypothetical protein
MSYDYDDERDSDGRWVGGMILGLAVFWGSVGWLIWRHYR